jgi:hypothetical protein
MLVRHVSTLTRTAAAWCEAWPIRFDTSPPDSRSSLLAVDSDLCQRMQPCAQETENILSGRMGRRISRKWTCECHDVAMFLWTFFR